MNEAEYKILKSALDTFGAQAQTFMVMEEMSELQKELCKAQRGKDRLEEIAEEIADVQIMLDQMIILHDCDSLVKKYRQWKLERLEDTVKFERRFQNET